MVVKKKKVGKKAAKKSVKKIAKKATKKSAKATKTVAKHAKKATKKTTQKNQKSGVKKTHSVKRVVKATVKAKTTRAAKPVAKIMAAPKPVAAKKPAVVAKPVSRSEPKIQPMIKQSKKTMTRPYQQPRMEEENFVEMDLTPSTKPTTLLGALEFTPYHAKDGEAFMNERQRDHFRKILDAWKQQLMQDVDTTVGHLKEEAVFYADPIDRASQEEGFNLELRTRDRERRLIKKIEQSLDLLNTNEYGFCEDCGAEIGIRRLEARPTAVKCIDCKTFQEIREKQLGG